MKGVGFEKHVLQTRAPSGRRIGLKYASASDPAAPTPHFVRRAKWISEKWRGTEPPTRVDPVWSGDPLGRPRSRSPIHAKLAERGPRTTPSPIPSSQVRYRAKRESRAASATSFTSLAGAKLGTRARGPIATKLGRVVTRPMRLGSAASEVPRDALRATWHSRFWTEIGRNSTSRTPALAAKVLPPPNSA